MARRCPAIPSSTRYLCLLLLLLLCVVALIRAHHTDTDAAVIVQCANGTTCATTSLPATTNNPNDNTRQLDLSHKNISSLSNGLFHTSTLLNSLNLSANHLQVLDTTWEGLPVLRCLDLADNQLVHIAEGVFAPLTGLQHLNLSRNRLTTLQDDTFKGLLSLQQLDLSDNNLTSVHPGALELSSLTRLLIGGNAGLGAALFIATGKRLQTLEMPRITLGQIPPALTHSIRTLHLGTNTIARVSRGDVDSYPLLQLLDLTANSIVDIEEDALGRLEMLTVLYLTDNHLESIPHSLPERLKVLHLERNRIASLRPVDLDGMSQLEVLLLNGNSIQVIGDGAFGQMINLVSLDLSANPLKTLPEGSLEGPIALRVLRLGGLEAIPIPEIVKEAVFPLPATEHLITLDVAGSPAVARYWLADTAALAAARELQELDLNGCHITSLPGDLLHYLPQLRSLHLRENALNCSGLQWLAEWMRRQEVDEYREVVCQSPGELWGTLLVDLQQLDIKTTTTTSTTTAAATPTTTMMNILPQDVATTLRNEYVNRILTSEAIKTSTSTAIPSSNLNMKNDSSSSSSTSTTTEGQPHLQIIKSMSLIETPENPSKENNRIIPNPPNNTNQWRQHPGMYLLIIGIMAATLILVTLSSRMAARKPREELRPHHRQHHYTEEVDLIEVSSLPSVGELW